MAGGWIHGGAEPELPFSEPTTSLEAAVSLAARVHTMRGRVLELIASRGALGATDDEIEVSLDMRHQTASARRRELVLNGSIVFSGMKRKTRSRRNAQVWITTGRGV